MNLDRTNLRLASAIGLASMLALVPAASGAQGAPPKGKPAAKRLALTAPSSVSAGEPFDLTVTAVSKKGKRARQFKGRVVLATNDSTAALPATYRFKKGEGGRHVFSDLAFGVAGRQTLRAAGPRAVKGRADIEVIARQAPAGPAPINPGPDPVDPDPRQTPADPGPINPGPADPDPVDPDSTPGPMVAFELAVPSQSEAGERFRPSATATDAEGRSLGDVSDRLELRIGSDGECDAGRCSATAAGRHIVTATIGEIARSAEVEITPGQTASIRLAAPGAVVAGDQFRPTATGKDQYGNSRGDVSAQTAFSLTSFGNCESGVCRPISSGAQTLTGSLGGISTTASVRVDPGPLSSLSLAGPSGAIAPAAPTWTTAQYVATRATSASFTANGRDRYGNSLGDVTSQATFTVAGRSCPGGTCSGGTPSSSETVTASSGSVTASAELAYAALDSSYEMSCRGESFDVNQNMSDGCERSQPNPSHATRETAIDLGSKSCSDNDSRTTFGGVMLSDNRNHVGPARSAGSSPPIYYKVHATGGAFCVNDMGISVRTSGGQDGGSKCYRVSVDTNYYLDTGTYDGSDYYEGTTGGRYYGSGTDVYFKVERICSDPGPEAVDYSVSFHL